MQDGYQEFFFNEISDFTSVNPRRIDTYASYVNNTLAISLLAYIDVSLNEVVYVKLDAQNGPFPSANPPHPFYIQRFPSNEPLTSVKFTTGLVGTVSPVNVTVTSNDYYGNGHVHLSKILFGPTSLGYTNAYAVQYLASASVMYEGGGSYSSPFHHLNNFEVQYGYLDVFTAEDWNMNYGIRRGKPGVDLSNLTQTIYCQDRGGAAIQYTVTNPVAMYLAKPQFTTNGGTTWTQTTFHTINGVVLNSNNYHMYLQSGANNVTVTLNNLPQVGGGMAFSQYAVFFQVCIAPQDEDPQWASDTIGMDYKQAFGRCNQGGGCPYIYVFDGSAFQQDNNILDRSEFSQNVNTDITDHYKINN